MRKNQPHHRMARLELLESRQMLAAGDVLVQLTRADSDFGADVQIVGDLLIVGAPSDDSEATDAGRVYVYQLNGKRTSSGFGTNELAITFNYRVTPTIAQQLVRAITFKTKDGAAGQRTILFTLSDGDGGLSDAAMKKVNVT